MNNIVPNFYQQTLRQVFNNIIDISYPKCRGVQNNVLFVKTKDGHYVAKFISQDMAIKNETVARLLLKNGVPVPNATALQVGNTWIETYPLISGQTLFERAKIGISQNQLRSIYDDVLGYFSVMENISPDKFLTNVKLAKIHNAEYEITKNTQGKMIAATRRILIYIMNGANCPQVIYHGDLNAKNILVDEYGRFVSFIDLDSVALCDRNFAFTRLALSWQRLGLNPMELIDKYEKNYGKALNRKRIMTVINSIDLLKLLHIVQDYKEK